MIKLTSKIYIHFLTPVMLFICTMSHHTEVFLFSYAVMTIHELAHFTAAALIGLKTDRITFYPYGVNLMLKNKFIQSIADEIILYLAGPLANCLMAIPALILYQAHKNPFLQVFYVGNILFFISNMLPVYPLDGGVLLKKISAYFLGQRASKIIMTVISSIFITALLLLGIYTVYVTEFNFSVMLLTAFLICSLFTQNEKYDVDFVRELMFYKNKSKNRIKNIIASEKESLEQLAKKFTDKSYSLVFFENEKGEITKIMSETEIMNKITGGSDF